MAELSIGPSMLVDAAKTPAHAANDPAKVHDAAQQFEALLIGQVLKTVHEDGDEGWLGSEDQTAGPAMGMADEYFAQAIAKRGGFGLAQMISSKLQPAVPPED